VLPEAPVTLNLLVLIARLPGVASDVTVVAPALSVPATVVLPDDAVTLNLLVLTAKLPAETKVLLLLYCLRLTFH